MQMTVPVISKLETERESSSQDKAPKDLITTSRPHIKTLIHSSPDIKPTANLISSADADSKAPCKTLKPAANQALIIYFFIKK